MINICSSVLSTAIGLLLEKATNGQLTSAARIEEDSSDKLYTIYVLQCTGGRYYVGKTQKPVQERIDEHKAGRGAAWTKKYPVERLDKSMPNQKSIMEDMWTEEYMFNYGPENVRGGTYTKVELPLYQIQSLQDKFLSKTDRCYYCKSDKHFARNCKNTVAKKAREQSLAAEKCVANNAAVATSSAAACLRCGRDTHDASDCYAKKHSDGSVLPDRCFDDDCDYDSDFTCESEYEFINEIPECLRCGRLGHYASSCYARKQANGTSLSDESESESSSLMDFASTEVVNSSSAAGCFRCGRDHDTSECFASRDVYGNVIARGPTGTIFSPPPPPKRASAPARPTTAVTAVVGCFRCGRDHDTSECFASRDVYGNVIPPSPPPAKFVGVNSCGGRNKIAKSTRPTVEKNGVKMCSRCGRAGHYASTCYVKKHINGKML